MDPTPPRPHERAAALLRRQQTTTARLRAGLTELLDQLDDEDGIELVVHEPQPPAAGGADAQAATDDPGSPPTTRAR